MPASTRSKSTSGGSPSRARAGAASGPRGDIAYQAILRALGSGRFKPGERIRELEICKWLDMSRTPVREALRRLEADGLLGHTPHAGMLVTPVDREMVAELYGMREVLEGTAARMAAENATRADVEGLDALMAHESRLPVGATVAAAHNREFHQALFRAAHNRYLLKSLRAISDSLLLLGPTTMSSARRQKSAHAEHRGVVEAIVERNAGLAESLARAHIRAAYQERIRMLFGDAPRRNR
jgi:DNA-binding GntR family transcriptional regulator